ncbi:MAG: type II secretion system protein GspM [Sphingopyxis sp.]
MTQGKSAPNAINSWWATRQPRERALIAVAAALTGAVLLWYPMASAMAGADARYAQMVDQHAAMTTRIATLNQLKQDRRRDAGTAISRDGALNMIVAQSAAERGFTLSRNDAAGDDAVSIAIANGRAPGLIGWVATLEEQGLVTTELSLRPNPDGTVAMTAGLRR